MARLIDRDLLSKRITQAFGESISQGLAEEYRKGLVAARELANKLPLVNVETRKCDMHWIPVEMTVYRCPVCGDVFFDKQYYCPRCGIVIEWGDSDGKKD